MIFRYRLLPSTSDKVKKLMSQGFYAPFAVICDQQTEGRGSHQRSWFSPAGNIYLSLALNGDHVNSASMGQLPIAFGILVCDYLRDKFGFRATLKWPNDLVFAGRKFAGILCEASLSGNQLEQIIVGIGINLTQVPAAGSTAYPATSVCEILSRPLAEDASSIGHELADYLLAKWQVAKLETLLARFEDYAIALNQPWERSDGTLWYAEALETNGALRLSRKNFTQTVTSTDHEWRWLYLDGSKADLALFDCGNTTFKLAYFAGARSSQVPLHLWQADWRDHQALNRIFASLRAHFEGPVFGISVNPQGLAKAQEAAKAYGFRLETVRKRTVRLRDESYDRGEIGIDRLALMEACLSQQKHGAILAASFGTALTIDVIDSHRRHLGGVILPGLGLQLSSLGEHASLLPKLSPQDVESIRAFFAQKAPVGGNTRQAILIGICQSFVALIESYRLRYGILKASCYATGGDAELMASLIGGKVINDATLLGARILLLGGALGWHCRKFDFSRT